MKSLLQVFVWTWAVTGVWSVSEWCGRPYMKGDAPKDPGGEFQIPFPASPPQLMLDFRCSPRVQPYLNGETTGSFIIDAVLTNLTIPGAQHFQGTPSTGDQLSVTITSGSTTLATGTIPLDSSGSEIGFDPSKLSTSMTSTNVTCSASLSGSTYSSSTSVFYLPTRTDGGSVTKQDFKTGALLVQTPGSSSGSFEPILPYGFFTYPNYLSANLSLVDAVKQSGRNMIHLIPPYDGDFATSFQQVLDRMKQNDLWLMYDMRFTFMSLANVTEEVNAIMNYPNLLLYYTGDEADGWNYPFNSTLLAGNTITSIDPYHPVSLILNCFDFYFNEYIQGASIIIQDTYPIGINHTFSVVWDGPCNSTFGDCGCDNCFGLMLDIPTRIDWFAQRLEFNGQSRTKTLWSTPQAFGNEQYWSRFPTSDELVLEMVVSINHGSTGIVPWNEDSTSPADLISAASVLGGALTEITSVIFAEDASFEVVRNGKIDASKWTSASLGQTLVMMGNMGNNTSALEIAGLSDGANITTLFATASSGVSGGVITVGALGSIAFLTNESL